MTDEQLAEAWKGLATWAKDSAISPLLIKFGRAVATTAVEAERQKNHPETPDSWAQAIPEDRAALVERIKEQAQVFASAWGVFDSGNAIQKANEAEEELHVLIAALAASPPPPQLSQRRLPLPARRRPQGADMNPQRRVVCAAIRAADGRLVIGIRHYSPDMHAQIARRDDRLRFQHLLDPDQGFVDQWGVYMTREEAYQVAQAASQILHPEACGQGLDGPKLYSEGLY